MGLGASCWCRRAIDSIVTLAPMAGVVSSTVGRDATAVVTACVSLNRSNSERIARGALMTLASSSLASYYELSSPTASYGQHARHIWRAQLWVGLALAVPRNTPREMRQTTTTRHLVVQRKVLRAGMALVSQSTHRNHARYRCSQLDQRRQYGNGRRRCSSSN